MKKREKKWRIIAGKRIHINQIRAISKDKSQWNDTRPYKREDVELTKSSWNPNHKILVIKTTGGFEGLKMYQDRREEARKVRIEYDKKYVSFPVRKAPWYMLDTRKRKVFVEADGKWKNIPSEAVEMHNRTIFKPNTSREWYINQLTLHKLAKWERKHPKPIKEDGQQLELFVEDFMKPWKEAKQKALERIQKFITSMYDKLPLTGRFQNKNDDYVEEKVAEIKDVALEGDNINELDPKKSPLLKKAKKETNKVKGKRANLVCTNLMDHKRKKGRIILPDYKQAA